MMGIIDQGAFELLLGGVSHITHKALVSIASHSAGPNASRWWWMEEEEEEEECNGEQRETSVKITFCNPLHLRFTENNANIHQEEEAGC